MHSLYISINFLYTLNILYLYDICTEFAFLKQYTQNRKHALY